MHSIGFWPISDATKMTKNDLLSADIDVFIHCLHFSAEPGLIALTYNIFTDGSDEAMDYTNTKNNLVSRKFWLCTSKGPKFIVILSFNCFSFMHMSFMYFMANKANENSA